MKKRAKKLFSLVICCIMIISFTVGCTAKGSTGTVKYNLLTGQLKLTHVTYYDFHNGVKIIDYSGECSIISNTYTSVNLYFLDAEGNRRQAVLSTPLSTRPTTVNLYTNASKTEYVTYTCKE